MTQSQNTPLLTTEADPDLNPNNAKANPAKWLRTVAVLTMPGFILTAALAGAEVFAPMEWKPMTLMGEANARYQVTVIQETLMDKAEALRQIQEAHVEGQRESEIIYQEKVMALEVEKQAELKEIEYNYQRKVLITQGNVQDAVKAYDRLYERTNMIQQVAHQMEANLMSIKQQAMQQTQGGRTFVTNLADLGCYFSPEACEVSRQTRQQIANDLVDVSRYRSGEVARDYLKGVEDPAQLRARILPTIQ